MTKEVCETDGCFRDVVVTFRYRDAENTLNERDLCLPCRRVIEYARRIPWNDEGDTWHDKAALWCFQNDG